MNAKLVVVGGETKVTEVQLNLPSVIGRGRSASLTLPHPLVSRQHCELYEHDGRLVVNDLGSLNGTFVGDQRIAEPTYLNPGDLLTVGTVTFRAVYQLDDHVNGAPSDDNGTQRATSSATVFVPDRPAPNGAPATEMAEEFDVNDADDIDELGEDADLEEVAEVAEIEEVVAAADTDFVDHASADSVEEIDDAAPPEEVEDLAPLEEVEEAGVDDLAELEEVSDVEEELEDLAEIEEVPQDAPAAAKPQPAPEAKAKKVAAPAPSNPKPAAKDEDDDDLQSFLRGLG